LIDLFLKPGGRSGRGAFWLGWLAILVAAVMFAGIPLAGPWLVLALGYPKVVLFARRLHDMGKSAWLILIPAGVSAASLTAIILFSGKALNDFAMSDHGANKALADAATTGTLAAIGIGVFWLLFSFAFLLWVGLSKGDPGDNRFGPPTAAKKTA